jgi:hypothetical protein
MARKKRLRAAKFQGGIPQPAAHPEDPGHTVRCFQLRAQFGAV